jgi:hypothetical protein
MARDKSEKSTTGAKPERAEPIKPMPFPGESPTVALAMAAGQMYGLNEEDEKPSRSQPKKRAAAKKRPAKAAPKRKAPTKRPSKGASGRAKTAAKRPAKARGSK